MAKTALYVNQQPGGLFGIFDQGETTGDVWFVNSASGSDSAGYGRSPDAPFATLDYAFSAATASQGDRIYVMPGHAETTLSIGLDKAGIQVIGLGFGRNRPTFTSSGTAADLASVSAANVHIKNLIFVGAAANCTALIDITSAGTDFVAENCEFRQAATPLSGITISGTRFRFTDCVFTGSANGPDNAIALEAHLKDWVVEGCKFLYGAYGLDEALIASAVDAQEGYVIKDIVAVGLDTLVVNFASSSAAGPDGLFVNGTVMYSAAVTSIEDGVAAATSKGMAFGRLYATDVTGKASGLIPLTTAS